MGRVVAFLIVLDQGNRAKMVACKHRKQLTLKPPSPRNEERFREQKTVYAAGVVHDQSGKERAMCGCADNQDCSNEDKSDNKSH